MVDISTETSAWPIPDIISITSMQRMIGRSEPTPGASSLRYQRGARNWSESQTSGVRSWPGTFRAWMKAASAAAALLFLVGCVNPQAERWKEAMQQASQIAETCVEKRLNGELPGYVAGHRCAESRVRQVLAESGWPYMDLVNLWLAYDLALSRRIDDGKISKEDGEVQFAELMTRITNEIERRDLAKMQARAQWLQSYGILLQGLGTWAQSLSPPTSHGVPITCTQTGRTITCY